MGSLSYPYLLYSTAILLREGFEAILAVVALAAGARQAGHSEQARSVYYGAGLAVAASLAVAWLTAHLLTDNAGDALEGVFQLFAAGTLFYVSSWLTAKSQADRWREFIDQRARGAQQSRLPSLALALTAFVAVIREGGETIIFYQGLIAGTTERPETAAVVAGILIAVVLLAGIYFTVRTTLDRIPIALFFKVTSAMLYLMAIVFVGSGIASLQEAGVVGATFVDYAPTIKVLGVFPTVQGLVSQASLAAFAALAIAAARLRPVTRGQSASVQSSRARLGGTTSG